MQLERQLVQKLTGLGSDRLKTFRLSSQWRVRVHIVDYFTFIIYVLTET